jgi:amidohydrolase
MNIEEIKQATKDIEEQLIEWRRHLHENPEVAFEEVETSQFIYDTLHEFEHLEVTRPTKTSVMARLIGSEEGKTIAIRADIDALPVEEETGLPFASKNTGKMHACGHDGHTAILLGTAKILSTIQDQIKGEVRFIFQPAEEVFPGGALEMVNAGVMEGVDLVIGNHLWSPIETGKIGILGGPVMAASDTFEITIKGKAGHAGLPHEAVDAVTIASQVVTNLQQIVARNVDPLDSLVLSVTKIHGGTAMNVLPGAVEIGGTVRLFDKDVREETKKKMEQIIKGITEAHGAAYTFDYHDGPDPVINDEEIAEVVKESAGELFGENVLADIRPTMASEDFSGYLSEAPGVFYFLGVGDPEKGTDYPHHHSKFNIDEDMIPVGVNLFVHTALKYVGK